MGFRVKEMPLKYFLSRTCGRSGRIFGYDFVIFLGQFIETNNYYFYSPEYILFIFIENSWPQHKGNAFEILFVKNLCRVGASFRFRFYDIFMPVSINQYY